MKQEKTLTEFECVCYYCDTNFKQKAFKADVIKCVSCGHSLKKSEQKILSTKETKKRL